MQVLLPSTEGFASSLLAIHLWNAKWVKNQWWWNRLLLPIDGETIDSICPSMVQQLTAFDHRWCNDQQLLTIDDRCINDRCIDDRSIDDRCIDDWWLIADPSMTINHSHIDQSHDHRSSIDRSSMHQSTMHISSMHRSLMHLWLVAAIFNFHFWSTHCLAD